MIAQSSAHERIGRILKDVEQSDISSLKSSVSGILNLIQDPKSNVKNFKDLIEVDPVLASQVLKVANSAYFGSQHQISAIEQAVIWIGLESLREIALSQKISRLFDDDTILHGFSRQRLWRHSLAVALLAKLIYRMEFGQNGGNAYAAGLIHDIGIIVEDQFVHDRFEQVLIRIAETGQSIERVEQEVLLFDHAAIGRAVTQSWGLPPEMVESIGCHHEPHAARPGYERLTQVLFVADFLVADHGFGCLPADPREEALFAQTCDALGLQAFAVDSLIEHLNREMAKMANQGMVCHE